VADQGLRGFLLAIVLANALSLVAAAVIVPWRPEPGGFDRAVVRGALAFSLPLLPHTLSHWALQLADRTVLAGLVSAASLGVFVLASNLAAPLLMVLMSLNQGFMPTYARAGAGGEDAEGLPTIVVVQIMAVAGLTLAAALLGAPLAGVLAPDSYAGAGELVPWIVLGYGFLGLYFVPMNGATLAAGRSRLVWVATASAAAFNIALLYLLVPRHGVEAAAVASAAAYGVLLAGTAVWAHAGPNPVRYDWRRIVPALAAAAAIYALATATSPADPDTALAVHAAWLPLYPIAMVVLGVIPVARVRRLLRR
jgi:O-antigen/teichoic acid export membrane protein